MNHDEPAVCIVDDDVSVRESLADLFRSAGLEVESFSTAQEYLNTPRALPPACLVLDINLPGLTGLDLQEELVRDGAGVPTLFITGQGDIPMSVRAFKAGALDFFTKPFDSDLLLSAVIAATAHGIRPRASASVAQSPDVRVNDGSAVGFSSFHGIVGQSQALATVLEQIRTVASTDSTVLIYGETGTGKERIARAVHDASDRKGGPFVKVNCGAIPAGLLESELMGHEKGAFTGAVAQRIGRFELAHNGSIFLDEIGEIALELQPKLLRLLQEREFERVGGARTVRTNARLIAATNRDLGAMVIARTFREDLRTALFWRLLGTLCGATLAGCATSTTGALPKVPSDGAARHARYNATPTRELEVNGTRLAYRTLGESNDQPPLVMLQHFTGTMDDWDPLLVEGLAQRRRVIVFDSAGVGRSSGVTPDSVEAMAGIAEELIFSLNLKQVDLLGFSLGGFITQQILVDHPQLVRRAVLVGTAPQGGVGVENLPIVVSAALEQGAKQKVHPKALLFFSGTDAGRAAGTAFMGRIGKHEVDADSAASDAAVQAQMKAIVAWGSMPANAARLEAITQPVLVVNGSNDIMIPTPNSFVMFQHIPAAELNLFPDSGHGSLFQYHDRFVWLVDEFLSRDRGV